MMGRAGAPIDITPLQDDPELGVDPSRNNNFRYDPTSQDRCPFAAHTRKTTPRSDVGREIGEKHRIIRHGIQFGPEVTAEEAAAGKTDTTKERGLFFVAYQSNIADGFQFIQKGTLIPYLYHGTYDELIC
jgi:deferrochelatase/peroxidase EfeB